MNLILSTLLVAFCSVALGAPIIIDDRKILSGFGKKLGDSIEKEIATTGKNLSIQLKTKQTAKIKLPSAEGRKLSGDLYSDIAPSVFIISSVYKCNRCEKWHRGGAASAWALTEDGVLVTNYHIFEKAASQGAFGVISVSGEFFPVTEILASSKDADVAIFQVKGSGFKPLPLKSQEAVGSSVNIIGHPDGRFFTYTSGKISRYFRFHPKANKVWMHVTAEYAKGSSGSPVFNDEGEVVGMVSSTNSIYYGSKKKNDRGPFQMVIRNCPTSQLILDLIDSQ